MDASSAARPKSPLRQRTHSRTSSQLSSPVDDDYSVNFGTPSELARVTVTTPPSAKTIPTATPSLTLAERARESMRLARERHLAESARKPAPRAAKPKTNAPAPRFTASFTPSVSRPRVQSTTPFNASRSRAGTPVSSHRPSTPSTPTSPRHSRQLSNASVTTSPKTTPRTANVRPSTAVRDAIAKAKEAHRQKVQRTPPVARRIDYTDERSFDDIENPFNLAPGTPPLQAQLRRAIETARTTGNLNISNLELQTIPDDVYSMYDLSKQPVVVDFSSASSGWSDSVDLERFNAAGNEIPDIDERTVEEFGGIKHFDVPHSGVLPSSFESLAFLRTLNLSTNALTNDALDSITQISTLVELYLAHNAIEGQLPSTIASLKGLYILDLVGNKITALPESIGEIGRMRILLLGDNQLESLPWDALETLGDLYELDISSNKLKGDLVTSNIDNLTLPSLSNLDVHANSLAALSSSLHLPSLTQFNATQNAITATGTFFTNTPRLVHLSLSQNQLAALPDGIVHLTHLRTLDISNNIIEHIDPRLGLLDELTTFQWMGNLIRSRAWGSMDTEGIKSALRAKADEAVMREISEDLANARLNACRGECHGILDLSGKIKEMPLTEEMLSEHVHLNHFPILSKIILQKNKLSVVPMELSLVTTLTTLDLSRNFLPSKLFDQPVILESLVNLDISVNRLDSLEFLPTIISAPALKILDVSFNSLTSLIPLRVYFPNITILHANSNQLTSITPSDFEGLEIVQVNNNSINRLPPELGLVDSVRILGVDGNTFRVPGRRIVDAGSAAVLEWLRGRCVVQN